MLRAVSDRGRQAKERLTGEVRAQDSRARDQEGQGTHRPALAEAPQSRAGRLASQAPLGVETRMEQTGASLDGVGDEAV